MGDSGEGLIDSEGKIQERMEELRRERERASKPVIEDPELLRQVESLELARKEIVRAIENTTHPQRKAQLNAALVDIDQRIAALKST